MKKRNPTVRRQKRASWLPWLVLILLSIVAVKGAFSLGFNLMRLAHEAREYRQSIALLRAEVEQIRQQNQALQQEIKRLQTRSGIILEARKQGYGFPGERLLVIEAPANEPLSP